MTFTKQDVLNAFNTEAFERYSDWAKKNYPETDGYSSVNGWGEMGYYNGRVTINGEVYEWKSVEDIGGEGEGDYRAVIFEVDGRLFRKEGYYQSHYGSDFDGDLDEVEPYEKTVTDYRTV